MIELDPHPPVFIAKDTGSDTFKEQASVAGELVDFTDGREVAIIDDPDAVALIEVADTGGGMKYLKVGGGSPAASESIGIYQGQCHTMVADNQAGWDFPRLHPAFTP